MSCVSPLLILYYYCYIADDEGTKHVILCACYYSNCTYFLLSLASRVSTVENRFLRSCTVDSKAIDLL